MHFLPIWLLLVTLAKIGGTLKHNSDTDRGLLVVQYFVWLSFRLIPSRNTDSCCLFLVFHSRLIPCTMGANASQLEKDIGSDLFPANEHYFGLVRNHFGIILPCDHM